MPKPKSKVKKYGVAMALLASMLLSSSGFALTINPQNDVICGETYCSLEVNLSKNLGTAAINALKSTDHTAAAKAIETTTLKNFKVSISGSIATFTANITKGSSNYWTFTLGSLNVDPWFNSTTNNILFYDTFSSTLENWTSISGDWAATGGVLSGTRSSGPNKIAPNINISNAIIEYDYNPKTTPTSTNDILTFRAQANLGNETNAYRIDMPTTDTHTLRILNNLAGSFEVLNQTAFTPSANTWYHVNITLNGNSIIANINGTIVSAIDSNFSSGYIFFQAYPTGTVNYDNFKIYTSTTNNVFYTTNLTLNGNTTNITLDNSTTLTALASTNLTGLNASLLLNGSIVATNLTNVTYTSNLTAGLYNITAYFFNASVNSSITLWANMTYTAPLVPPSNYSSPYPSNSSWSWCTSNSSLLEHRYEYNPYIGAMATIDNYLTCPYGCSNTPWPFCQTLPWAALMASIALIIIGLVMGKYLADNDNGLGVLVGLLCFLAAFVILDIYFLAAILGAYNDMVFMVGLAIFLGIAGVLVIKD